MLCNLCIAKLEISVINDMICGHILKHCSGVSFMVNMIHNDLSQ